MPPMPPGIAPPPIMPPKPLPPPPSIMRLIIGPMVCIIMAKRRLPIFAFIMSSIGAIWVIMSSPPPPPPKPANWALAGIVVSVNSSKSMAAWHTTLSAPVMVKLLVRRAARGSGAVRTHGARLGAGRRPICEKDHTGLRGLSPEALLHRRKAELHLPFHVGGELMRQHVRDPDEAAARLAFGKHLGGGAVLRQAFALDGVDQPPALVVAVDQYFARHRAVG